MRRFLAIFLAFCLANVSLLENSTRAAASHGLPQEDYRYESFTPEQLDNLLAPIALYPDPLLSQVLVAATFVEDIDEAARWVRAHGTNGIDDQSWDISVKAVAHYPTVIDMMADKLDWTTTLGQAYVSQSTDVMISIQRLRRMAYNVGNLVTTPQQQVVVEPDYISIVPYQPQYIYLPVYDPYICYYRRPAWGFAITFGVGFLIGSWLNRDCDWHHHRVYYHGWSGGGWIHRGRPYVHVTNVYVNDRYRDIRTNRNIIHRNVNINNIDRYNSIHRDVGYTNIRQNNENINRRNNVRPPEQPGRPPLNNKIINRNIDTTNPRLDQYRGRQSEWRPARPREGAQSGSQPQPQRPAPQPGIQPQPQRPTPPRAARPTPTPPQTGRPAPTTPPAARPTQPTQPPPRAFGKPQGNIDPRASSQRGQSSRQTASPPRSAPPSRPQAKPTASPHSGDRRKP